MVSNGLVDEVKKLKAMGCTSDMVSMKGIGYKEMIAYFDGEYGRDEAIELLFLAEVFFSVAIYHDFRWFYYLIKVFKPLP